MEGEGVEVVVLSLESPAEAFPPPLKISFAIPLDWIRARWVPYDDFSLHADWCAPMRTDIAMNIPLCSLVGLDDASRLTIACSEARRSIDLGVGIREQNSLVSCAVGLFQRTEAPLASYRMELRLDRRRLPFYRTVREAAAWLRSCPRVSSGRSPALAYEPVYSSWHGFHKELFAHEIEAECALAAPLGMKTLILDDGWQEDENRGTYSHCGDWKPVPRRFPDMKAHVARIHALGMKYVLWYAVPLVGFNSEAHRRFQGKFLYDIDALATSVVDPRFPEVRAYLVSVFEKAIRDWDLDGFKFDFVNQMTLVETDPAIAENFAGRDIRSLPEAVDVLLGEITDRLKAIKPDLLVEFRQPYVGPSILRYGNMFRAADCPTNVLANRLRIVNLRLTSGDLAVHSDMLEWHAGESAEDAAQQFLASLFGVIQYSMRLGDLPASHREMMLHWLSFARAHRETLLRGDLRPRWFSAGYPVIEAVGEEETIYAVYSDMVQCVIGEARPTVIVVNASASGTLYVDLPAEPRSVEAFDTFGRRSPTGGAQAGPQRVAVPKSGYLLLRFGE